MILDWNRGTASELRGMTLDEIAELIVGLLKENEDLNTQVASLEIQADTLQQQVTSLDVENDELLTKIGKYENFVRLKDYLPTPELDRK